MKKILLFARDSGGANIIGALYQSFINKGYDVVVYGKDTALIRFKAFFPDYFNIMEECREINIESIVAFIKKINPDFIITGTSGDDYSEKYIWHAAEKLNIKSYAVLDQWINYGIRFSKYSIKNESDYRKSKDHEYLPTRIFTMDEYSKTKLMEEGIPEEKIRVTGQPYFEYILKKNVKDVADANSKVENGVNGENSGKKMILFASQPISELYGVNEYDTSYWGYTETTVLRKSLEIIEEICTKEDKVVYIVIKLHPRENKDKYLKLAKQFKSPRINIAINENEEYFDVLLKADLVLGMFSMLLIEAAILGISVASVQLGLKKEDAFILNNMGLMNAVTKEDELYKLLEELIVRNKAAKCNLNFQIEVFNNILNCVEEKV